MTVFSELEFLATYPFIRVAQNILVDVGAHEGGVSRRFASMDWRIVAFEPEDTNWAALRQNLSIYPTATMLKKAVSDVSNDLVPFYVSSEHFGIHSLKPFHATHQLAYDVETTRLDDILRELQLPTVTLLKIDIEGADFLALRSFNFLQFQPQLVMVEFMDERSVPNFGYDHHDMAVYMQGWGYRTFVSEWEPIKEYGRKGIVGEPHVWRQCAPYPLEHEPAWGNLIFVPETDTGKFETALAAYLRSLRSNGTDRPTGNGFTVRLRQIVKQFPGATTIYRFFRQSPPP